MQIIGEIGQERGQLAPVSRIHLLPVDQQSLSIDRLQFVLEFLKEGQSFFRMAGQLLHDFRLPLIAIEV